MCHSKEAPRWIRLPKDHSRACGDVWVEVEALEHAPDSMRKNRSVFVVKAPNIKKRGCCRETLSDFRGSVKPHLRSNDTSLPAIHSLQQQAATMDNKLCSSEICIHCSGVHPALLVFLL